MGRQAVLVAPGFNHRKSERTDQLAISARDNQRQLAGMPPNISLRLIESFSGSPRLSMPRDKSRQVVGVKGSRLIELQLHLADGLFVRRPRYCAGVSQAGKPPAGHS